MYRKRFGLTHRPLPRDASGTAFFDGNPAFSRLRRMFSWLAADPGLGCLTGDAGVGKTAAMRCLCAALPEPEHRILYICDTAVTAASVYRNLAAELGLTPAHRRDALWRQLKETIAKLVDTEGVIPILVIDEAQHLSDDFLCDLAGFLNWSFDSRDLLTVWLVGTETLEARLRRRQHAALYTRIVSQNSIKALSRDVMAAMLDHGLQAAGATSKILAPQATEILIRVSRGLPRVASALLRGSLQLAHERDQNFVDEKTMLDACELAALASPKGAA